MPGLHDKHPLSLMASTSSAEIALDFKHAGKYADDDILASIPHTEQKKALAPFAGTRWP